MPITVRDTTLRVATISKPEDRELYGDLIARHHYLGDSQINRNSIVHVVRRGRDDLAILTWEPRTRHWFGLRDRFIGWTAEQRAERLKHCVENRRFCMLVREPNLASRVLALSMARLNEEGHDYLLAETFVDPRRRYEGTCYKAAGWREVGLTQGGRGARQRSRKKYFVKELKRDAIAKLKAPNLCPADTTNPRQSVLFFERLDFESLRKKFDQVPEYRKRKGSYPLTSMLVLISAAILCGETSLLGIQRWIGSLSKDFLRKVGFRRPPSHTTIWRVITNVESDKLCEKLSEWLMEQSRCVHIARSLKILSLDGKTLRAAAKTSGAGMHLLTLIDSVAMVVRNQITVGEKTNEISHASKLLEPVKLDAQTIVTGDALHTQEKVANAIEKKTAITSFPSKTTSQILERQSLTRPQRRTGRYRSLLRSLRTDE